MEKKVNIINEKEKLKLGVDIDDVLIDTFQNFLDFHNENYNTDFKFDEHDSFEIWFDWIGDKDKAIKRFYSFFNSTFFKNVKPTKDSIESIKILSKKFKLFAITSRDKKMQENTKDFFNRFFNNSFQDILFTNQFSGEKFVKTKAQICNELGISILIEDRRKYALECAQKGIKIFLMNKPWNQNCKHENIVRVKDWKDILDKLENLEIGWLKS